jgi:Rrf2 family protein
MLKISTKSQYGLRAMAYLASKKKVCSIKKISKDEGIPFDYLEKIVSRLEKAGLLKSKKGVQGGYLLTRPASKIKAGEIVSVLEEKTNLVKCLSGACSRSRKCLTRSFWLKIQKALDNALNSVSIADLMK